MIGRRWLARLLALLLPPLAASRPRAAQQYDEVLTLTDGGTVEYEQREADSWRWWVMAGRALGYLQVFFGLPPYFEQNLDRKLKFLFAHTCAPPAPNTPKFTPRCVGCS